MTKKARISGKQERDSEIIDVTISNDRIIHDKVREKFNTSTLVDANAQKYPNSQKRRMVYAEFAKHDREPLNLLVSYLSTHAHFLWPAHKSGSHHAHHSALTLIFTA
jgi:hypothetical protein